MSNSEDCSSTPNRNDFDLNLILSNVQDLFSLTTQIRRIQAATIDLLKVKGLITSEEFVAAHEGVIAHGLQEVGIREKSLRAALQDVGPNATKTIK
mgnify:FL=1